MGTGTAGPLDAAGLDKESIVSAGGPGERKQPNRCALRRETLTLPRPRSLSRGERDVYCSRRRDVACSRRRDVACSRRRDVYCSRSRDVYCSRRRDVYCSRRRDVYCSRRRDVYCSLLPPGEGPGMRETCASIAVLPCRGPVSWVLACTCGSAKTPPPPSRSAPSDRAPPGRSAGARNVPSGHPRKIQRPGAIAPGPPKGRSPRSA